MEEVDDGAQARRRRVVYRNRSTTLVSLAKE